ncbi:MAG: glycosyltransferase [Actinomycetota bacterium]
MSPRISIGLPVYNGARFLDASIRSLRAQTYGDFELIIADNASTDESPDIIADHAADDDRITVVRSAQNLGAARNFNIAYERSRGELFKWASDDDVCEPEYLARCAAALDERPDAVWCQSRIGLVDPEQVELTVGPAVGSGMSYVVADPARGESAEAPTRGDAAAHRRLQAVLLETVGDGNWDVFGLVRRTAMERTGLQRPHYGADKVFVAELALQGAFVEVDEPLFLGRLHERASGALDTVAAQRAWIDPLGRASFTLPRLQLLRAHLGAVLRADLPPAERARCLRVIGAYGTQVSKWKRIVRGAVRREGTGGGYRPFLDEDVSHASR